VLQQQIVSRALDDDPLGARQLRGGAAGDLH
jgi:hypothetical protein